MSKFEKKFGKYAVQNISLVLILCYVVGYIITLINGNFLYYLTLNPYEILFHGQIWRLITWIIVPPTSISPFTIIMLLFYYNIGTTLEQTWGTYRYNVYLLSGMLFTVIGSFLCMGYIYLVHGPIDSALASFEFALGAQMFSTYYINMSIFLAFAATFPDAQVLLMFIIPIKVKWMGILEVVLLIWDFIGMRNIYSRVAIAASLLNFAVFYFVTRNKAHLSPKQIKRRAEFKQEVRKSMRSTRHKCAVCGRTEEDDDTLEFRVCSKCNGNYEYCQAHLFTHEHVK